MEIFFHVVYHFGWRGREWIQYNLVLSNLVIVKDDSGKEYVDLLFPNGGKNAKAYLKNKKTCSSNRSTSVYAYMQPTIFQKILSKQQDSIHLSCPEIALQYFRNSSLFDIWNTTATVRIMWSRYLENACKYMYDVKDQQLGRVIKNA